jgi:hypothetical protein
MEIVRREVIFISCDKPTQLNLWPVIVFSASLKMDVPETYFYTWRAANEPLMAIGVHLPGQHLAYG